MRRYIVLLLVLLTALPVRANLGDTVKQLVARYGTPVNFTEPNSNFPFGTIVFSASGITLVVFLEGEKEVGAKVFKTKPGPFADTERDTIMNADVNGSQWVSTPSSDPNTLTWTRSDQATVMYDKQRNMIIFTSDEMTKAIKTAETAVPATNAPAATAPDTNKSMLVVPPAPMSPPELNLPPGK